jgi:hypothetical protein
MELKLRKVQEGMPGEREVVLIFLARTEPKDEGWALAYYTGSKWCFEVPREIFIYVEKQIGYTIQASEEVLELGSSRVEYWAGLPKPTNQGERRLWDVFLCHASEDKEQIALPIARVLSAAGITCWNREIPWGQSITKRINTGLMVSRYVVVVLSENFIGKPGLERELNAALEIESKSGEEKVLPLIAGDETVVAKISGAYPVLAAKQHLRWTGDRAAIVEELRSLLDAN